MAGSGMRFAELQPGSLRVTVLALRTVAIAMVVGAAASFILTLIAGLTLQESFSMLDAAVKLDDAFRLCIGLSLLTVIVGATLLGVADSSEILTLGVGLRARLNESPQLLAPSHQRSAVLNRSTFGGVRAALWALLVFATLSIVFCLHFLFEENTRVFGAVAIVVSGALAIAFWLVQRMLGLKGLAWWDRLRGQLDESWARSDVDAATTNEANSRSGAQLSLRAERDYRLHAIVNRLSGATVLVFVLAFVITMAGTLLRQPCSDCEEQYFGQPVENLIDFLTLMGAVLIALGIVLMVLAAAIAGARKLLRRADIVRVSRFDGQLEPEAIHAEVTSWSALELTGMGALSLNVVFILVAGSFAAIAQPGSYVPLAATAVAVCLSVGGILLVVAGAISGPRYRNNLRSRWSPGDEAEQSLTILARVRGAVGSKPTDRPT